MDVHEEKERRHLAEWVKCFREDKKLRRLATEARDAVEENSKKLEGYCRTFSGVGPNIPQKFLRVNVDGEQVIVGLRWVLKMNAPRDGSIEAFIVEVE